MRACSDQSRCTDPVRVFTLWPRKRLRGASGSASGGGVQLTRWRMAAKTLSVVVPAYDEALNIRPLTERLFAATRAAKLETELIVADDESSGSEATREVVEALAKEGYSVRLHARRHGMLAAHDGEFGLRSRRRHV